MAEKISDGALELPIGMEVRCTLVIEADGRKPA